MSPLDRRWLATVYLRCILGGMDPQAIDCPCLEAVPESRFYTLEFYAGRRDRHPGFAEMVQEEEWVIACRRCGRRWLGEHIVGGGIYGDTLWRPENG